MTAFANAVRERLETRWLARTLHAFDETDSTNRVALELASGGAAHGTTVLADAQTRGRGRHGRSFFSPHGENLYTSIVLRPDTGEIAPTTVLGAGLAVAEAVSATLADAEVVSIKWPNDVQIRERKTSGILMEAVAGGPGPAAVLGIGVNLNGRRSALPEEFRARATTLAEEWGKSVDRPAFAARLYRTLEGVLDAFATGGFEAVRPRFESYFRMTGTYARVADLAGELQAEGTVVGIGADGALRLRDAAGRERRVLAGDVTVVKDPPRPLAPGEEPR